MKPIKLTLHAFGPFVTTQEVDFTELAGEEIFLVTGETGAGKTTIFDAMSFALFGSASGDMRKPNTFKSDHAPANELCFVEFSFALREHKYFVHRSPAQRGVKRDGSYKDIAPSAELTLPDGEIVTGANAVTERLERILGLNHKQFKQTTMLAQGEFRQLIEASGKEKQQIFSKIFGTSMYSDLTELLVREEANLQRITQAAHEKIARCVRELGGYGHAALAAPDAEFFPYNKVEELVRDAVSLHEAKSEQLDDEIAQLEAKKLHLNPEQAKALNDKLDRRDRLRLQSAELKAKENDALAVETLVKRLEIAVELASQEEIILSAKKQVEAYVGEISKLEANFEKLTQQEHQLGAVETTPELESLEKSIAAQKSEYERLYRDFLNGQSSILAKNLSDGLPCTVCGSTHHPAPANTGAAIPTENDVNGAKKLVATLEKQSEVLRESIKNNHRLAKSNLEKCSTQLDSARTHHDLLQKQFDEQRAAFVEKLTSSGFSGYKDYRSTLDEKSDITALKRQTLSYREKCITVDAQLKELERDCENHARTDVDALIKANDELSKQLAAMRESKTEIYAVLQGTKKRLLELKQLHEENAENDRRHAIARELASLARGSRTVSFERYILAAYFDDIIKLSNIHLQRMTGSRYRLRRLEDAEKGAGSGLDMEIIDSYTGKPRDVATLSGGESFKASLALALGLSAVVQMNAGGVSIDTMFIDEGFGSLDEKSLDSAVETLISLKKSGRMVGIISHVPALRGYIPKKLAVRYSPTGSTVQWL